MGREGVEPSTSRLSGVRSNHLSYRPNLLGRRGPGQGSQCFALESLALEGGVEPVARRARAPTKRRQASPEPAPPVLVEPIGIEPMTY